jgi:hypothetical protein
MGPTNDPTDLQRLGDALSASTERDVRRGRGRSVRRAALALAVIAVLGTGSVAAATLLTPKQVATAMPAGAVIFDQTDPTCTADPGGKVFHCTLGSAPAPDEPDYTGSKQTLAPDGKIGGPAPGKPDYTGSKQTLVADGRIAGGCIGQDVAGMHWDCYVGQDAVDMEIITQDFLGEPAGPSRG